MFRLQQLLAQFPSVKAMRNGSDSADGAQLWQSDLDKSRP
jgi:hypothetical protein